jgi:hypothetical protein
LTLAAAQTPEKAFGKCLHSYGEQSGIHGGIVVRAFAPLPPAMIRKPANRDDVGNAQRVEERVVARNER